MKRFYFDCIQVWVRKFYAFPLCYFVSLYSDSLCHYEELSVFVSICTVDWNTNTRIQYLCKMTLLLKNLNIQKLLEFIQIRMNIFVCLLFICYGFAHLSPLFGHYIV